MSQPYPEPPFPKQQAFDRPAPFDALWGQDQLQGVSISG